MFLELTYRITIKHIITDYAGRLAPPGEQESIFPYPQTGSFPVFSKRWPFVSDPYKKEIIIRN